MPEFSEADNKSKAKKGDDSFPGTPHANAQEACQSYLNLLNQPPADPKQGALSFGEYVLAGHEPPVYRVHEPFSLEDSRLINSDIYRADPDKPLPGPFVSNYVKPPEYLPALKRVFGGSTFDISRNHNTILDTNLSEELRKRNLDPKMPVVLMNVDMHSDIIEGHSNSSFADWVNPMLARNPNITDFYWILPNETAQGSSASKFFPKKDPKESDWHLTDAGSDKTLFVANDGQVMWNHVPFDYKQHPEKYRIVQFHKRTLNDMPDLHGKQVALTTDLDFFDNRGFDTTNKFQVPWKGDAGFQEYANVLDSKGVRPFFHFVSASPEYVRGEHVDDLLRFAVYTADSSQNRESTFFTHHYDARSSEYGSRGIQEKTQGNRGAELLWQLFSNDIKTTQPDGAVIINKANPERTSAIRAVMKAYKVDSSHAMGILRRLDAADGTTDGVINFRLIEGEAVKVCHDKPR